MAPPRSRLVPFDPRPPAADLPPDADPERLARDPEALARFVERHPERLDPAAMTPPLAVTLARLLLEADRTFLAERLLAQAAARWPEEPDVVRGWARVLVSLGRSSGAVRVLERALAGTPNDPGLHYLLGMAALRAGPQDQAATRRALEAWEKTVALDPGYRDPDGTSAAQLREAITRMRRDLGPSGPAAP